MRLKPDGHFIEPDVKPACRSVLSYDEDIALTHASADALLCCAPWCRPWQVHKRVRMSPPRIGAPCS